MAETELHSSDLRRARRERGVNAVLDVALDIFTSGTRRPSANEIARRAGVSTSSFFRYFDSIDDLRNQVADRYLEQHRQLLEPSVPDGAELDERRQRFVEVRIRAGAAFGPVQRSLSGRAADEPGLLPIQARFRAVLARQVEAHFGPELADATPARRDDLVAVVDTMTSIDAYRILRETHERSDTQIRRAWLAAIDAVLCR